MFTTRTMRDPSQQTAEITGKCLHFLTGILDNKSESSLLFSYKSHHFCKECTFEGGEADLSTKKRPSSFW